MEALFTTPRHRIYPTLHDLSIPKILPKNFTIGFILYILCKCISRKKFVADPRKYNFRVYLAPPFDPSLPSMALIFVKGLPYFIPQAESFPSFEAIGESIIDVENLEKALCTLPKPQIIALAKKLQIPHKTDTSSTIIAGRIVTKVCVMLMTHSRSTAVSTTASDSAPSEPRGARDEKRGTGGEAQGDRREQRGRGETQRAREEKRGTGGEAQRVRREQRQPQRIGRGKGQRVCPGRRPCSETRSQDHPRPRNRRSTPLTRCSRTCLEGRNAPIYRRTDQPAYGFSTGEYGLYRLLRVNGAIESTNRHHAVGMNSRVFATLSPAKPSPKTPKPHEIFRQILLTNPECKFVIP